MRVFVDIEHGETEGDYQTYSLDYRGACLVPTTTGRCQRCGHEVESYGDSEASIKRTLAVMAEECPRGERNFYTEVEEDPDYRKVQAILAASRLGTVDLNDWELNFIASLSLGGRRFSDKMRVKLDSIYRRLSCNTGHNSEY